MEEKEKLMQELMERLERGEKLVERMRGQLESEVYARVEMDEKRKKIKQLNEISGMVTQFRQKSHRQNI